MARLEELIGTASNIWQAGTGRADLDISGLTADSRQVRAGYLFAALPGSQADGRQLRRRRGDARRRRRAGARRRQRCAICRRRRRARRDSNPRRRLALLAARLLRPPAADHRRRHRHQRQDLDRRFHPPALDAAWATRPPASARSASWRRTAMTARRADHARSGRAASRSSPSWPTPASTIWRWKPRATASTSTGSTACGCTAAAFTNLSARPSRLSRHAWRPISPPSARLFADVCCRRRRRGAERRRAGIRTRWPSCAAPRAADDRFGYGQQAGDLALIVSAASRADGQDLTIAAFGAQRRYRLPARRRASRRRICWRRSAS